MATFRELMRDVLLFVRLREQSVIAAHRARKEAEQRGIQLLSEHLSREQRIDYETRGYFHVTGGDTGKRYRIQRGHLMNVEQLDQRGNRVRLLCFMPKGGVPMGDV